MWSRGRWLVDQVPVSGCQVPGHGADISTSDLFLEKLLLELELELELALENQRW